MSTNPAQTNPLTKFFRQPAIYFMPPSGGKWWPEGSLIEPETGELPVYPMTSKDEIILRTPDALMNGQGIVDVIKSCVPHIIDPWKMPAVDVDATLIAMRIASYGHNMDFESKCPHCGESHTYGMDLRNMLEQVKCPDYDSDYKFETLTVKFHPQQYFGISRANKINFEVQKLNQALETMESNDATSQVVTDQMNRLIDLNYEILAECTEYIYESTAPEQKVADKAFILEFYKNADAKIVGVIQDKFAEIAATGRIPAQKVNCGSCSGAIEMDIIFDYSNFFVDGS